MKTLAIIQVRLTSTRLPGKVLMLVNGRSMISRVCKAARDSKLVDKVVVAWAHKFPDIDENNVLERFRHVVRRENPDIVVRLTSDCPLLEPQDIDDAIAHFKLGNEDYYNNAIDGFDVQVFYPSYLYGHHTHKEHVINDMNTVSTGLSVNTLEDLERVERYAS